jgi:hypothetical protein
MRSISHNPNIIFIFWTFICSCDACCVLDPRTFFTRIKTFVLFYKICMVQLWSDWKNLVHENELLIFINRMASSILVTLIIYTIGGLCNEIHLVCTHDPCKYMKDPKELFQQKGFQVSKFCSSNMKQSIDSYKEIILLHLNVNPTWKQLKSNYNMDWTQQKVGTPKCLIRVYTFNHS